MVSKKNVLQTLEKTFCRLKPSAIGGIGIFAIRDIPKGADPFPNLVKTNWKKFNMDELKSLDPEVLKMIDDFFVIEKDKTVWMPEFGLNGINISFFLNHSKNPNVTPINDGDGEEGFITLREIKKDEELTSDYGTYDYKWICLNASEQTYSSAGSAEDQKSSSTRSEARGAQQEKTNE